MNTARRTVSEDDLQAYVDGWLDPARREAVERHLADHPDEAARVRAYQRQAETLRAALRGPEGEAVPTRLLRTARGGAMRGRAPWWPRAAAAVLLLAAGGAAGWGLRGAYQDQSGGVAQAGFGRELVADAAAAHKVYSVEVRHPVEVRAEEAHLVAWLSKRVGRPLKAPDLKAFGFRLMGGRLLPVSDGAAAQFMYEDTAGRRVTCYARADTGGEETAFRFADENGLSAFYWLDGSMGYALVGPLKRTELFKLAQAVYRQTEL
jgi:anti-sigma factor RsiW